MANKHTVILQPSGRRGEVEEGTSLRAAARELGVDIESICAENATCGKCKILCEQGEFERYGITSKRENLTPVSPEEAAFFSRRPKMLAKNNWEVGQVRLSCQARVCGDLLVNIPEESLGNKQIVRKSATDRVIEIKPSLRKYLVEMMPPTLSNPKADWERLASGLATSMGLVRQGQENLPRAKDLTIDYACLQTLGQTLRDAKWRVTATVWQDKEVVRVEPGYSENLFGAAIDIGSTTIALYLCNLENGEVVASESEMNPQIVYGEDVMSRIQYTIANEDGLEKLHNAVINTINQLLARAAKTAEISIDDILEMAVVGNSTMHHLFLGVTPRYLGVAPFVPTVYKSVDVKARELGIKINRSGNIHVLPTIASFLGDTAEAMMEFARILPAHIPRIALVDFNNDSVRDSLLTLEALFNKYRELMDAGNKSEAEKYKLYGIRLDTSGSLRDVSVQPLGDPSLDLGVTPRLVFNVRQALDSASENWSLPKSWKEAALDYCRNVKIVVSGGFNPDKINKFEKLGVPVDIYAVGSYLFNNNSHTITDFTADVVRVKVHDEWIEMGKVGRKPGRNENLERVW